MENKITLVETTETDEALRQLKEKKKQLDNGYFITYFFTMPFLIWIMISWISTKHLTTLGLVAGIAILFLIIVVEICFYFILMPYREQLKLAKRNDEIRHEERVRFLERQALESGEVKPLHNINIKKYQKEMEAKQKIVAKEIKKIEDANLKIQQDKEIREKVQKELEQYKKFKK